MLITAASIPIGNLKQKYFAIGNLGFPVWYGICGLVGMCICNDRRWPEIYLMCRMLGGRCSIAPSGEIVAKTINKGGKVIIADCDLGLWLHNKKWVFNFDAYRCIEHYGRIAGQTGIVEPAI